MPKNISFIGGFDDGLILVRPRTDDNGNPDGYKLVCGNRRKRACEIAEIPTLPVIIRELDDDSAAIAMVDSNLGQREKLLPSEKAWAYQVKLEALNHQGVKSETPGQLSVEILCEQTGKLTAELIDEMLSETKKPPKGEPTGSARFRQYFPPDYTNKQMDDIITTLLKNWRKGQATGEGA